MAKKQLTKITRSQNNGYKQEENLVRMNFEVSEELRNAFKAKVASQGKKVKDVLAAFMVEYIKDDDVP